MVGGSQDAVLTPQSRVFAFIVGPISISLPKKSLTYLYQSQQVAKPFPHFQRQISREGVSATETHDGLRSLTAW